MAVWPIRWNITQFLPSIGRGNTHIWMHHMNTDNAHREKAWRKLHKNPTSYIEQIQEAKFHETAAVRLPTSYLINKMNKACRNCWRSKNELISSPMDPYIQQLCADVVKKICRNCWMIEQSRKLTTFCRNRYWCTRRRWSSASFKYTYSSQIPVA